MHWLDWLAIAVYFALLILIGVQTMRRVSTADDFAVAGNRIIWPVFFGSLAAAFLGGGASLGVAGATMRDGYVYMLAFAAFGLQTFLVGLFVAPRLKNYRGAHTLGDVMHEHYGRPARVVTGVLSVALCTGILGAQALAVGTVVNATLGLPVVPSVVVGMGIVILYSTMGGAWAVIQTDLLQFVFLGVLIPVALLIGLDAVGGAGALVAQLPADHMSIMGDYSATQFIGLFAAFLLGETLVPPYVQRTFSTPDSTHARRGFALSGAFSFVFFFVSASIGLVALVLYPDIPTDSALPTVVSNLMPVGLLGLVVAALLAVVMSTASSYINSTAVSFTDDLPPAVGYAGQRPSTGHDRAGGQCRRRRRCHRVRTQRSVHRRRAALQLHPVGAHDDRAAARRGAVRRALRTGGPVRDRRRRCGHRALGVGPGSAVRPRRPAAGSGREPDRLRRRERPDPHHPSAASAAAQRSGIGGHLMLVVLLYAAPIVAILITLWAGFLGWRFYVTEVLHSPEEEK